LTASRAGVAGLMPFTGLLGGFLSNYAIRGLVACAWLGRLRPSRRLSGCGPRPGGRAGLGACTATCTNIALVGRHPAWTGQGAPRRGAVGPVSFGRTWSTSGRHSGFINPALLSLSGCLFSLPHGWGSARGPEGRRRFEEWSAAGDFAVWPFPCGRSDYEAATSTGPVRFAGLPSGCSVKPPNEVLQRTGHAVEVILKARRPSRVSRAR